MNLQSAPSEIAGNPRYSGLERLYGVGPARGLSGAHVCIVGVGGVGGWVAEALARSGIGTLTLVDMDEICASNQNRQVHALDGTVGQAKIEAMAERIRLMDPGITVHREFRFFTETNCEAILGAGAGVVVDCIDSIPHKCLLVSECRKRELKVVTVGAAGGRTDPTQVRVADLSRSYDDALLQRVRKKLRQNFDFPRNIRKKWGIPAVFSPEAVRYPQSDGTVCARREEGSTLRLDCASGYGTAGFVTGSFGFAAAAVAVELLLHTE